MQLTKSVLSSFFVFSFFISVCHSQDERTFRKIIAGEKPQKKSFETDFKYVVKGGRYQLDFDGDGLFENFQVVKGDGFDLVEIRDCNNTLIFQHKLKAIGRQSSLFKINFYKIASQLSLYVLHYYEGFSKYLNFVGSVRIYFLTIEENNLKSFKIFEGPAVWLEQKDNFENYVQRKYDLKVDDFNKDGIRDLLVKFDKISRVYFYLGNGKWAQR